MEKDQLIIQEAIKRFAHFGYKKTIIDEIVRSVGIAKGTFYLYFQSKEQLFMECMKSIREEMMGEFLQIIKGETSARGKLRAMLKFSLVAMDKHPLFARVTRMDEEFRVAAKMVNDPGLKKETEYWIAFLKNTFQQGIAEGELRQDLNLDVIPLVFASLKLMHFFRDMVLMGRMTEEQFLEGLLDIAMNGISKQKTESAK